MPTGIYKHKPLSKKTKGKISKSLRGHKGYWEDRKLSKKHRKKVIVTLVRNYWIDKKFSKEHKRKISNSLVGNKRHFGIKHSLKTRKRFSEMRKGSKHPNWKGGITKSREYIVIHSPNHPFCNKAKYVYEHRLIMEKKLGRYLRPEEVVHHIDRNPMNNHPDNLQLFANQREHSKLSKISTV